MKPIEPKRLKQLRLEQKLTREHLAQISRVSARQIARLEAAEGAANVRETTIIHLAKALKVDPDVLIRGARQGNLLPDPPRIQPKALAVLRKQKGWSRTELATLARVSPQLVERIERSSEPCKVRPRSLRRLAKALEVKKSVLLSATPLLEAPPTPQQRSITVQSTPDLRLAYDLVTRRFGITRDELFALAPMLFVLLAEGSLDWRREKLQQVQQASQDLETLGSDHPTLYFAKRDYQHAFNAGVAREKASIERSDLRGREVWDDAAVESDGFREDDLMRVTPFAGYLEELAKAVGKPEVIDFSDLPAWLSPDQGLDIWGANPCAICQGDLDEIAGGSAAARWALEWGEVRISEIPEELMSKEAKSRRAAWLESRLSDDVRAKAERRHKALEERRMRGADGGERERD